MPSIMFPFFVIHNSFVSDVYLYNISDMKCQIHHLHLEQYFIQQKHNQNFRYLC